MLPWRIISSSRQRSLASLRLPWQLEQPLKSASSKERLVAAMPTHYRGCGRSSFCREIARAGAGKRIYDLLRSRNYVNPRTLR
jgi:hypothetical protein